MSAQWTAIILAGQRPGPDPLASHFGITVKALVPVMGEAMLTHVLRTIQSVPAVVRVIVLAQDGAALADAVAAGGGGEVVTSGASISLSLLSALDDADVTFPVLVTTADHPLLTPAMVTAFIDDTPACDLAVAMVERATMLAVFPEAQRTWLKLRDGAWSGANLFALRTPAARHALLVWAEAEQDRKRPWRLFRHFGLGLALRAITRTIGLGDGLERAGRRLGLSARLVPMADPVAAIDVDKPQDHALAEIILAARAR